MGMVLIVGRRGHEGLCIRIWWVKRTIGIQGSAYAGLQHTKREERDISEWLCSNGE